jgi:hypothetical protein
MDKKVNKTPVGAEQLFKQNKIKAKGYFKQISRSHVLRSHDVKYCFSCSNLIFENADNVAL